MKYKYLEVSYGFGMVIGLNFVLTQKRAITEMIIKITISSLVIGLKKSHFPLIRLPSCYRTVCYRTVQKANYIQRCGLKQPITFKVVTNACTCACLCVYAGNLRMFTPPLSVF